MAHSQLGSRETVNATVFAKRTIPAIAALVAATYLVAGALLMQSAWNQDVRTSQKTEAQIRAALNENENRLVRTLLALAQKGEAYENLHLAVNLDWAFTRDNLGPRTHALLGISKVFVIAPEGDVIYALSHGKLLPQGQQALPEVIQDLSIRASMELVRGVLWVDGQPAFIGVTAITPGADPTVSRKDGPPTRLMFVRFLDTSVLAQIGEQAALPDLRLVSDEYAQAPMIRIATLDGPPVLLSWSDELPGKSVAQSVLPWYAACGGALVALTWMMLGHAATSARVIERSARDMTVSREALLASEARFRDVAEAASDWIWETDAQLRVSYLSERFETLTGRPQARLLNQPLEIILHPSEGTLHGWVSCAQERPLTPLRCRYITADGAVRTCRVAAKVVIDKEGRFAGFRGTATDITAEVEAHRKVEYLALYDALTSLPNRTLFMEYLAGALSGAREGKRIVALLRLDLLNFKKVNERHGLTAGDQILTETAQRIRRTLPDSDLVARLGADDFALVVSGPEGLRAIEGLCQKLQEAVSAPFPLMEGDEARVACAIGIALAPVDAMEGEELLRCAELALQQAQGEDPPGYLFFTADLNEQVRAKRTLEHDLRRTVGSEDFMLLYQPRFHTSTLEMVSVEALVRWQHPRLGLLSPDQFIPLAESTGLIIPLGEWALRRACATVAKWPDLTVSVNVSPVQFRQGSVLIEAVQAALQESGLPPYRLELELTESVLLENTEKALDVLLRIKELGVRLVMDDFGTGYSSLSYLRHFPFDRIKIDRRFIGDLDQSPDAKGIVEAILALGRALGLAVTAEGVETAGQFAWLRKGGCDEVQGFHFAVPLSEADLATFRPRPSLRA